MNIALAVLKNGVTLVSQSDELEYEPKVHLTRPMAVSGDKNVVLTAWPKYTDDVDILLRSDDLLTVCEPTERVLEAYMKKCGIKASDLNSAPKQVILTEEQNQPSYEEDPDDYEPRYIEEF